MRRPKRPEESPPVDAPVVRLECGKHADQIRALYGLPPEDEESTGNEPPPDR